MARDVTAIRIIAVIVPAVIVVIADVVLGFSWATTSDQATRAAAVPAGVQRAYALPPPATTSQPSTTLIEPAPIVLPPAPTIVAPVTTAPQQAPTTTQSAPQKAPTTTAPLQVPTTTQSAPPAVGEAPTTPRVVDLTSNIQPVPNFLSACGSATYNDSAVCVSDVAAATDRARAIEGLPPIVLPFNWTSLNPAEQLFVVTNLERTARGLAPLTAMSSALDLAAIAGVITGNDPRLPSGFPASGFGSNWAGAVGNPLEAMYYWMYDDGLGSNNVDCSTSNLSACWGHRNNVLFPLACNPCVIGTAWGQTSPQATSVAELIVSTVATPRADFTWAQEQPYLP